MKYIINLVIQFIALMALLFASTSIAAKPVSKKVIMILSGYGQQQGEETPGYEFDEFSKAYDVFNQNGFEVDIASPKGGKVEADKYDPNKSYNAKVLSDSVIMTKLNNTLTTAELSSDNYDAIFIVGGKGAMFDLPKDPALKNLIADIYQQQGSVAAVCHGPAALIDVTLDDGSYLVANKAINGFTNKEEKLFGKKWLNHYEFLLEDKLIERGAHFQSSDIMLSHVASDSRLITGQNPSSTVAVATELVRSLGVSPVHIEQDIEDKTLAMISNFLAGDNTAVTTLAEQPEQYHLALVGMYGFYYLKAAQETKQFEQALALMSLAKEAINNPLLDIKIAETQHKLGKKSDAIGTLNQLLVNKPDYQPALDMLKTLSL